ncbi:xanthine dehydrogenase family protein molybdopterin-binding subunit [Actinomadura graeca]|uniref:Xanthine dehydrogenase family protein molybdopterin-binding subunit n=1 Tax=Actinomadura graeca TaxID=2750812 RepID=A0ABX8QXF7_9ACTN|nr:xanthine dehydrogenase family protein molybdopterin-binding subunit [Actinomadura graeca]QXJ23417.1 xanthine dehydrogenase family protein molybdopterin-binding subunit [Actinomadura graeca]
MTVIGKPLDRVDGKAKTTGAATFSAEYAHPGLAHAALVHATISRGRVTAVHTGEAEAVPGVIAVLTHHNAPPLKPAPKVSALNLSSFVSGTSVDYLQTDEVHWDGQPIAVVVAETSAAAREAAALVRAEYAQVEAVVDFAAAEADAVPQPRSLIAPGDARKGDAEAALAAAPIALDLRFTTPPQNHNALEPHATTAVWDGDRLTVHDATQAIDWFRAHLAVRFGIPAADVRVLAPFVGGGFGGKGAIWPGTILAALAARATGRPVRLALSREGVYRTVGGRTASIQRVALGATRAGRLTALVHTSVSRTGRIGGHPEPVTSASRHLYDAENMLIQQKLVRLDLLSNAAMRAPGEAIGTFALESAIDELASAVDIDPIELRMRNEPAADPLDGTRFSHRMLREAYRTGAERFGWAARTPEPRSMRDGRWLVGMGVASAYHPSTYLTADLTVRLSADGSVLVRCGFQEMGMGGATAQAQIAADALGVPFEDVRVEYGDSALPKGPIAGGSVQTATIAGSLLLACGKLRRSLRTMAKRTGGEGVREILERADVPHIEARIGSDTRFGRLSGQARFMTRFMRDQRRLVRAAAGAHFCEVRVDPDTGEIRVTRWTGVFDIGRVVNPKTAAGQLRGGIVMGLGAALSEATLIDPRTGRIMNPGLAEYHVPVHADVPPIEVHFLDDPDPTMPGGILGAGELGITGVAGAVANAVHHATGIRVRDLPITLDKLL